MPTPRKRGSQKLSTTFTLRFWEDADSRTAAVKEVKRRYETMRQHVGAESIQQDLLVQRAVFMSLQLEAMETEAILGEGYEIGVYTQMTNALMGLLKTLGLKRQDLSNVIDLHSYLDERE